MTDATEVARSRKPRSRPRLTSCVRMRESTSMTSVVTSSCSVRLSCTAPSSASDAITVENRADGTRRVRREERRSPSSELVGLLGGDLAAVAADGALQRRPR